MILARHRQIVGASTALVRQAPFCAVDISIDANGRVSHLPGSDMAKGANAAQHTAGLSGSFFAGGRELLRAPTIAR